MIVRVLCEDFRKDQYIIKPVVEAMMAQLNKPRAKVEVIRDPLLGSVSVALNWSRIQPILDRYSGMTDFFLLIVDRDGEENRIFALRGLEEKANLIGRPPLFAENAWQEVEVWALAAQEPLPARWSEIRADRHPKETYFEPLVRARKLEDSPGGGRLILSLEAGKRYGRVKTLCPEDVGGLEQRIDRHIQAARRD